MKKIEKYIYIVLIIILVAVLASTTTYFVVKNNNTEVKEKDNQANKNNEKNKDVKQEQDNKEDEKVNIVESQKVETASEYLILKGEMTEKNGYRYQGANPNNYIVFNNELWRIIGVFETETSVGKTENLVKIIRKDSIGKMHWNSINSNDWSKSDLKEILNNPYYNGENIEYIYKDDIKDKLKVSGISLNDNARNMAENVKWYLGGINPDKTAADNLYASERGKIGSKSNPKLTEWIGYVGLMYPSDVAYSVDTDNCVKTERGYCDPDEAGYMNWTSIEIWDETYSYTIHQWTISPSVTGASGVYINSGKGYISSHFAASIHDVRPAIYLKSNVSILDNGKDGSEAKPYDLILN